MSDFLNRPILWGLDPLFHVHVKLLAGMLNDMIPGRGWSGAGSNGVPDAPVFFYRFVPGGRPRPVCLVQIGGIVVTKNHYAKVIKFTVDDGSGTVSCVIFNQSLQEVIEEDAHLDLGCFVRVHGRLDWKAGVPSVLASRVEVVEAANGEINWWVDLTTAFEEVYATEVDIELPPEEEMQLSQEVPS